MTRVAPLSEAGPAAELRESAAAAAYAAGPARPFVGLRSFTYADRDFFFGRTEQVDALEQILIEHRLVAVVGSSGSGKSSLVRAGLLPRLAASPAFGGEGWTWVELRPGEAPIHHLAEALARPREIHESVRDDPLADARAARIELTLRQSSFGIRDTLALLPDLAGRSFVLLVDQFEEVFRFADLRALQSRDPAQAAEQRDEAAHFVQLLLAAADDDGFPGRIVLTMRSDFIGDCARFYGLSEAVTAGQYLVPALTRDQRATAITAPVARAGGRIEPALVQQLLNDTNEDPDQLPVLQHALMRCWQRAVSLRASPEEPPCLTAAVYQEIGGVTHALARHANEILRELTAGPPPPGRPELAADAVTKRVFQALTDSDRHGRVVRRPQRLNDLVGLLVPAAGEEGPARDAAQRGRPDADDGADHAGAGSAAEAAARAAVQRVVGRFAHPDCSFLRTTHAAQLDDEVVVDIGHEALIRCWDRLGGQGEGAGVEAAGPPGEAAPEKSWVREEQEDGERLRFLLHLAAQGDSLSLDRLADYERWWARRRPNRLWVQRYAGAAASLDDAAQVLAQTRHRAWQERRRNRAVRLAVGTLLAAIIALTATNLYTTWQSRLAEAENQRLNAENERVAAIKGRISVAAAEALGRDSASEALLIALYGLEARNGLGDFPEIEPLVYGALLQLHETRIIEVGRTGPIAFTRDGRLLVMSDGRLRLIDPATGRAAAGDPGPGDGLRRTGMFFGLMPSPDGGSVLVSGGDGAYVQDLGTRQVTMLSRNPMAFAQFSPDGRYILAAARGAPPKLWGRDAALSSERALDRDDGVVASFADHAGERIGSAVAAAFSAAAERLAISDRDGVIHVFDMRGAGFPPLLRACLARRAGRGGAAAGCTADPGEAERALGSPWIRPYGMAFHPVDPDILLVTAEEGAFLVRLSSNTWDALPGGTDSAMFRGAAFNADGTLIASASGDGALRLWTEDSREQPRLLRSGEPVRSLALNPADRQMLASASRDGTIRIWSTEPALSRAVPLPALADVVTSTLPSKSSEPLATAAGISLRWDEVRGLPMVDSQLAGIASFPLRLSRDMGRPQSAAFSRSGRWLAVAPQSGSILLFDLLYPQTPVAALGDPSSRWRWVGFAENPDRVVGTLVDGRRRVWRYFPERADLIAFAREALPRERSLWSEEDAPVGLSGEDRCRLSGDPDTIFSVVNGQSVGNCQ